MSAGSKGSGSEEPLVPDDFDEDYYNNVLAKIPEITKALHQKDTHENADNVSRLVICSNRYKQNLLLEENHSDTLNNEIAQLNERLKAASELSRLDQSTIEELRNVIESAWKQKDAAQSREQDIQEEVMKLRERQIQLTTTLRELSEKRSAHQSKRDDLMVIERLNAEIRDLNKRLHIQRVFANEVETMTQTLEEKNKSLLKLLDENSSESYAAKKQMDELQKTANQLKTNETKLMEQISQTRSQNEQLTKMKVKQNLQVLSLKTNLEHLNTQHNANCNKLAKTTVELEYAVQERDKNKRDLIQKINLLKVREDDLIKFKQENGNLVKSQETIARKLGLLKEEKSIMEKQIIQLRTQLGTQDKELEGIRRIMQHFENNNNNLVQERDGLKRELLQEQKTIEKTDEHFQESKHEIKSLKDIIQTMDLKYKKLNDDFNKLKKEKAKKMDEIQTWIDKIDAIQNEIHLKENCEIELKRTIADLESKYSQFQSRHECLLTEKNGLQRIVQTMEEDKVKLRQQLENLQNAIEALKGKLVYKDGEIGKLELQIDRMEKERRLLKNEFRNTQLAHQHTRADLLEKKKENNRFSKSLQDDEQKLAQFKKELDNLRDEKNAINVSLVKRNDELAKLKADMDNLRMVYEQTEKHFNQSQNDIRVMRIEIKNLRCERNVLKKDRENAADLRQELLQIHRVLNQERIKARALQEEMMTPMNIHRWRNLKGLDPEKMNLIEKIQALRKQILNYNVTAMEQERALEESQRLIAALKEFMSKLPSYKIKEELNEVKANLNIKDRKLKALVAELNTKAVDEKNSKLKLEEIKCDLANAKVQLSNEKKKKKKLLEERQMFVQMQSQCYSAPPTMQRIVGGGFKFIGTF